MFGDHISDYDIQRAVFGGATVSIYYGSRLAGLEPKESERPKIDPGWFFCNHRRALSKGGDV